MNKTAALYLVTYRKAALAREFGMFAVPIKAVGLEILEEPNELCIAHPTVAAKEIPAPNQ
jgi:hypothetical protein